MVYLHNGQTVLHTYFFTTIKLKMSYTKKRKKKKKVMVD